MAGQSISLDQTSPPEEQLGRVRQTFLSGNVNKALEDCRKIIGRHPAYVGAHVFISTVYTGLGNTDAAIAHLNHAHALDPDDPTVLGLLASSFSRIDFPYVALSLFKKILDIEPEHADALMSVGFIYAGLQASDLAIPYLEQACKLRPRASLASTALGKCYEAVGMRDEATAVYARTLSENPAHFPALYSLAKVAGKELVPSILKQLNAAERRNKRPDLAFKKMVANGRSYALHAIGRYDEAWREATKCNELASAQVAPSIISSELRQCAAMLELASAHCPANVVLPTHSDQMPLSLYFLGPSRSGKSTLEQLIARIPGTFAGYEEGPVRRVAWEVLSRSGHVGKTRMTDFPEKLRTKLLIEYQNFLQKRAPGARIFTSTLPGHIWDVATICESAIYARFVVIDRDYNDLAARIYFKNYDNGNSHSYRINTIYEYIGWYYSLARIWSEKFPSKFLTIRYEDMVNSPKQTIDRIADHIGIHLDADLVPQTIQGDIGFARPYLSRLQNRQ